MHRAGRAGRCHAERLAHHVGDTCDVVDGGVELGHRLEGRHVVDLLVDFAELGLRIAPAGEGNHRRMRQICVAQARGDVERADHLRHANARLAGGARITVRHVDGRFLAVAVHPGYFGAPLHLGEGAPQNGRHHEDVGDAVTRQHIGEDFSPGAFGIVSDLAHCCFRFQSGLKFSATPLMQ